MLCRVPMMSGRWWLVALALLVCAVYAHVAFEVVHAELMLVNDFRPFTMARLGMLPGEILRTLTDATREGAWLYRPFPDLMEWLLSSSLREQPGAWHLVILSLRLVTIALAYAIAREAGSPPAAAAGAAYLAFFPGIPEINLLRADNWLMPLLALTFLGWMRMQKRGESTPALRGVTAAAFVLATMSKEIFAPFLAIFLAMLAPHYRRRGRLLLAVMLLALANQAVRFALMFADPYAAADSGRSLLKNGLWVAKTLLLATNAFIPFSLLILGVLLLGALRLVRWMRDRETRALAIGIALPAALSLGMALTAPYHAIRYACPAALFLVPCVVAGFDELASLVRPAARNIVAAVWIAVFALFGGTALWAQAASLRASSNADWEMLQTIAHAYASGRDVVVIEDADFERSFWMRAELAGADPRWPFLSSVATQYATAKPITWPPPPAGPVRLTGWQSAAPGRFLLVPKTFDFRSLPGDPIIVPANPFVDAPQVPPSLAIVQRFDARGTTRSSRTLERFRAFARSLNRRFRFGHDLGETEFPGHYWVALAVRRD
ncbi:MAG TPA: hypothetical protein VFO89_11760 [Thermoanaerobaculia bacterium]|nr:hypothetical protein [Thermoanaerobaculia bacterium]